MSTIPEWAEYGIFKVGYANALIERVEVRSNPGMRLCDVEIPSRVQVVTGLGMGASFRTIYEVPGG